MRKLTATFIAVAVLTSAASAQLRFGVKAGANFAHLKTYYQDAGNPNEAIDNKTAFNGGVFATLPVSSKFSIQPEVVLSMEGGKDKPNEIEYNFSYLNVPVLLQYNAAGFFGETGPQVGFLLSANATHAGQSYNTKEDMKSTAFAWALGAGYRLPAGIGIHARYNLGLSHILKGDTKEGSTRGRVVQVDLSYAFGGRPAR